MIIIYVLLIKISHSYFMHRLKEDNFIQSYNQIIQCDIKPLLEEYFYGETKDFEIVDFPYD